MPVTVTDAPERGRYEAWIDGDVVGYAAYERRGSLIVFTHTEVNEDRQGEGVAGTLARAALDDVRRRGLKAVPRCPYIAGWIRRHPDYVDVLAHRPPPGPDEPR